jgi:hypothetical protein
MFGKNIEDNQRVFVIYSNKGGNYDSNMVCNSYGLSVAVVRHAGVFGCVVEDAADHAADIHPAGAGRRRQLYHFS